MRATSDIETHRHCRRQVDHKTVTGNFFRGLHPCFFLPTRGLFSFEKNGILDLLFLYFFRILKKILLGLSFLRYGCGH